MARYSHSKVDQFKKCPKKYEYQYVEDLNPIEDSVHLVVGKLVHSCLEALVKDESIDDYLDEFKFLVRKGMLPDCREDTLADTLQMYLNYYAEEDADRNYILIEEKFEENIGEDIFSGVVDDVYEKQGYYYLEDHKTTINKLKYSETDVRLNRQLHKYCNQLAEDFFINIDFITINEIVVRKLDYVPILKNGTPTKDTKQLSFVLYEEYIKVLTEMGLENDSNYKNAIEYLEKRGHPLFKRTTVEVNQNMVKSINDEYNVVIKAMKEGNYYRVPGPLCNYCAYKDICNMELQGDQEEYVKELKATNFAPSKEDEDEEFL